jgi:hypothetical protein
MPAEPITPRDRDATLRKLRDLRTTIALGSAGAAVAFAVAAAVTIPGKDSTVSAAQPQTTQDTQDTAPRDSTQPTVPDNSDSNSGGDVLQQPQQDPGAGVAGGGQAVSGGSR